MALDVGTTNWKASIFDEKGKMVDIERCPTITHIDDEGYSYYDAKELWDKFVLLIKNVVARNNVEIAAISIASLAEAVVPIDKYGSIIDNIITWYDTRSMKQANYIKEKFGAEKLFSITGLDANPIFSLAKILWMRENRPRIYEKVDKWLQMSDFLMFKLSGEVATDYTLASRTLAFDIVKNEWSQEILNEVDVSVDVFPKILESGTVIGYVNSEICKEVGLKNVPKVVVGGHDHPLASIVAGAINQNKMLDSSGTAETFIYISEKGKVPNMLFKGQRTGRYLQKDRYLLWGGIIASGRSFDWGYSLFTSSKIFGIEQPKYDWDFVLDQILDVKAIEQGLIYYPHLRGAGAPHWDARMSGSFIGIRDNMDNRHFLRAVLEGLCMQARMIIEMHEKISDTQINNICVVGGSSKNSQWQQIKANITGKNIEICYEPEATSLGAAMMAAIGDKTYASIEEVSGILTTENIIIMPQENTQGRYDEIYEVYKQGYKQLEQLNVNIFDTINKQNYI